MVVCNVEVAHQNPAKGLSQRLVHHFTAPARRRKRRSVGVLKVQTQPLTPFSRQPVSSACTTGLRRIRSKTLLTAGPACWAAWWMVRTMAPTLSFNWWAVRRYHWIVLTGNRPSSRRVMIRLTGLTPSRCRPTATPCSGSWGSRRFRHNGHVRAMKTCSVTSTRAAGISMTSRVRCTQPPLRVVWHSGQDSGAWTTRLVGSIRVRAKPWGRFLRGFFSCSAGFLRLAASWRPGIPATAGQPGPLPASTFGQWCPAVPL